MVKTPDRMRLFDEVLKLVNEFRAAIGKPTLAELPQGIRDQPQACPVFNALDASCTGVGRGYIWFSDEGEAQAAARAWDMVVVKGGQLLVKPNLGDVGVGFPGVIETFVEAFDEGDYPELEKHGVTG